MHFCTDQVAVRSRNRERITAANKMLKSRTPFASHPSACPPDGWVEQDVTQTPSSLLLTHTCAKEVGGFSGPLTLITLFVSANPFEVTPRQLADEIWGRGVRPALAPEHAGRAGLAATSGEHYVLTTDVQISGKSLTADEVARLFRHEQRDAPRACVAAQVLHTLRACVTSSPSSPAWAGGSLALRHFLEEIDGPRA